MNAEMPCLDQRALALGAVLALGPLGAQDAAAPSSGDDVFNSDESVTTTTDQTQNAAPRNDLLKEAAPRITGTFTGTAGFAWNWSDIYNTPFNICLSDQQQPQPAGDRSSTSASWPGPTRTSASRGKSAPTIPSCSRSRRGRAPPHPP